MMLQTIRDACKFDQNAIDYALRDQFEDLIDLAGHEPGDAEAFFKKTYVTGGIRILLRQGLQRLAGVSGQAVFELKKAMGGGKTHSMLALGYLAANPNLFRIVPKEVTDGFKPPAARVVAISGRSISRDKHLWGDIADQLGKAAVRLALLLSDDGVWRENSCRWRFHLRCPRPRRPSCCFSCGGLYRPRRYTRARLAARTDR
jgi:hypothetical protein